MVVQCVVIKKERINFKKKRLKMNVYNMQTREKNDKTLVVRVLGDKKKTWIEENFKVKIEKEESR